MRLPHFLKFAVKKLPVLGHFVRERDAYRDSASNLESQIGIYNRRFPPGHFHSTIPSLEEIKDQKDRLFKPQSELAGVDLREEAQVKLFHELASFYSDLPFSENKNGDFRYYYNNPHYAYSDGIVLATMLRRLEPKKIIEVGSGFSSGLILDLNDHFFDSKMDCEFIEPYPELTLNKVLSDKERASIKFHHAKLEDCPLSVFSNLEAGDVLFIDSSHVSKIGSDVNYFLFEIFPRLASGVFIHIHDIFYPFEYPAEWLFDGVAWNEAYLLRAFLQFNSEFQIEFFY